MIKNSATRMTLLTLVVVVLFNVAAYADGLSTFRLRIEDTTTGVGRVITDNVKLGVSNVSGDQDSPTLSANQVSGAIYFNGYVGNAFVTIYATSGTLNDGFGGGVLSLSARVLYNVAGGGQIKISLEDSGYTAPAPTATFIGSVGGYDYITRTTTSEGHLSGLATSISLQTWLNAANDVAPFGANGSTSTALNPATVVIPTGSITGLSGGDAGQQFTSSSFSQAATNVPVSLPGGSYSIMSQATLNFSGVGVADFNLTGTDPKPGDTRSVPEPTSLLLLGSGLVGLGMLRRKKS